MNLSIEIPEKLECLQSFYDFKGNACFLKGYIYDIEIGINIIPQSLSYKKEKVLLAKLSNGGAFVIKSLTSNRLDVFYDAYFKPIY